MGKALPEWRLWRLFHTHDWERPWQDVYHGWRNQRYSMFVKEITGAYWPTRRLMHNMAEMRWERK
jgi:hypothetical protein